MDRIGPPWSKDFRNYSNRPGGTSEKELLSGNSPRAPGTPSHKPLQRMRRRPPPSTQAVDRDAPALGRVAAAVAPPGSEARPGPARGGAARCGSSVARPVPLGSATPQPKLCQRRFRASARIGPGRVGKGGERCSRFPPQGGRRMHGAPNVCFARRPLMLRRTDGLSSLVYFFIGSKFVSAYRGVGL